jgi:hypothetical protein
MKLLNAGNSMLLAAVRQFPWLAGVAITGDNSLFEELHLVKELIRKGVEIHYVTVFLELCPMHQTQYSDSMDRLCTTN